MSKYQNQTKRTHRGWTWNQLVKRLGKGNIPRARVFCLIGDTVEDLEVAQSKGFSIHNVIGVDLDLEKVERWREAGGLAIQAPLEAVVAHSKIRPQGLVADFCNGINSVAIYTLLNAYFTSGEPGAIVVNLLRGRDQVKKVKDLFVRPGEVSDIKLAGVNPKDIGTFPDISLDMNEFFFDMYVENMFPKQRSFLLLLYLHAVLNGQDLFLDEAFIRDFFESVQPETTAYKSEDSNQYFDLVALNTLDRVKFDPNGVDRISSFTDWSDYDIPLVKRRLAALEAVRTQRLKAMPLKKAARVDYGMQRLRDGDKQPVALPNECGECTACCTVLGIGELHKPEFAPCRHLCATGCSVYSKRPKECATYKCIWRDSQDRESPLDTHLRPDNLGVIVEVQDTPHFGNVVVVREVWPGASKNGLARNFASTIAKVVNGAIMFVIDGEDRQMYFPSWAKHLAQKARDIKFQYLDESDNPVANVTIHEGEVGESDAPLIKRTPPKEDKPPKLSRRKQDLRLKRKKQRQNRKRNRR